MSTKDKIYNNKSLSLALIILVLLAYTSYAYSLEFVLPRQPLAESLKSFARHYKVEIFFSSRDVSGRQASAVAGNLTVEQALKALLNGSGMTFSVGPKGTIIISRELPMGVDNDSVSTGIKSRPYRIEEVVTTARKREESLQRTPISISVFSSSELESRQFRSIHQVSEATPNMIFDPVVGLSGSSASSVVFIRGVGQLDFTLNTDPGVGIYLDNVYLSRSIGALVGLLDIEQVEVLRGPQGTLFGRNTIGGAINITTKKPNENYQGRTEFTVGRFGRFDASSSVNIPIKDNLFSRFSISSNHRDGYMKRFDGQEMADVDSKSGRVALRWLPSANLAVDLAVDATQDRAGSAPATLLDIDETALLPSLHNQFKAPAGACYPPPSSMTNPNCHNRQWVADGKFDSYAGIESRSDLDLWAASSTVTWSSSQFTFKSISAYREFSSYSTVDLDHSPLKIFDIHVNQEVETFTQEFQLLGSALEYSFDWITGLYYFKEEGKHLELINASLFDLQSGGGVENSSLAFFAQGTYWITEKLSMTTGIRYTDDIREFTPDTFVIDSPIFGLNIAALAKGTRLLPNKTFENSSSDITPMLSLAYAWTENWNIYFTYSEGFKSGGFTQRISSAQKAPPDFGPEFVDLYEVGVKYSDLNNRLRINSAFFHNDYTDIQVLGTLNDTLGASTINAGEADVDGFEIDITYIPTAKLHLQLGIGYLDAKYTKLGDDVLDISLDSPLSKAAKWTVNGSVSYVFPIDNNYVLTPRVDWQYRSEISNTSTESPQSVQESYKIINASVSLVTVDGRWKLTLNGKNLTDKKYTYDSTAIGGNFGINESILAPPRTWALSFSYKWN